MEKIRAAVVDVGRGSYLLYRIKDGRLAVDNLFQTRQEAEQRHAQRRAAPEWRIDKIADLIRRPEAWDTHGK
jgi:hypothetical protein